MSLEFHPKQDEETSGEDFKQGNDREGWTKAALCQVQSARQKECDQGRTALSRAMGKLDLGQCVLEDKLMDLKR